MATGRRARGSLEHEVLAALSAAGGALTPGQVRHELGGALAYTTVMTVLARLHDKGVVSRTRYGRAYAYEAVRDEAELTARQMQRLLDSGDDRRAVLSRFVGALSGEDERLLIELLRRVDGGEPT